MSINWFGYYMQQDGYGRFNSRFVDALQKLVQTTPYHIGLLDMPEWMLRQQGINWNNLTITCTPPYMVKKVPGRQWLFSMTEGSIVPAGWVQKIEEAGVERLLVPCQHNVDAFHGSGVRIPIFVVPGGTDPYEFPFVEKRKFCLEDYRPYTFLCFADRGDRKGFQEVWDAFYLAFGGKTRGLQSVRLVVKARLKDGKSLLSIMSKAVGADRRIIYQEMDEEDMSDVYRRVDCLVLPSRSEGWGMIHREAACMGLPVITQQYSGMDDGFTKRWALVVEKGEMKTIPIENATALGEWRVVDKDALAQVMKWCYYSPETAAKFGMDAARWIRENQTWEHAAQSLLKVVEGGEEEERKRLRDRVERRAIPLAV